jgi:hypothetical protein
MNLPLSEVVGKVGEVLLYAIEEDNLSKEEIIVILKEWCKLGKTKRGHKNDRKKRIFHKN